MTEKLKVLEVAGRVWTAAVAYVALIIGAGLSITFNVVDVMDVRGPALDRWDIVTAVAFPALVVLMVELFVSRLWTGQRWPMQIIRWAGTLAIGGIAMRVSWVHGHDFFLSRGQAKDVANLAPLAIDLLAIMATALILSGRGRVQLAKPVALSTPVVLDNQNAWTGPVASGQDVAESEAAFRGQTEMAWTERLANLSPDVLDTDEDMFARLEREMSSGEPPVVPVPVSTPPARRRAPRNTVDSAEAALLALVGRDNGLPAGDIAELLAGWYGVSARTIRREPWWKLDSQAA